LEDLSGKEGVGSSPMKDEESKNMKQRQTTPNGGATRITERIQFFVVEVIRNIAEYAVFSERFGKNFMDIFIERNCLSYF